MVELSDPVEIAGLEIRNRFVMPPMVRERATEDGEITEDLIQHYVARSMGGVGLIIVEAAAIAWEHRIMKRNVGIHEDRLIPGLARLAEGIKAHGSRAFIQINHCGPKSFVETRLVGPSPVQVRKNRIPEELAVDEIHSIQELFVDAACRAQQAGFDGVEVHGAHFYLLSSFLSSYTNRRNDDYGGTTIKKAKFMVEIVKRIREELGDYPLILRINGIENVVDGIDIEEAIEISKIAENAGVDSIHVSCVVDPISNPSLPPRFTKDAMPDLLKGVPFDCCVPCAAKIKAHVSLPVIGVGMVRDAEFARSIMRKDLCDLLGVGRGLLADAEFALKTLEGRDDEIIPWKDAD
ncbi:MAG: NADH:flavin oxidoreductase [Promethearchaeota archaeon]